MNELLVCALFGSGLGHAEALAGSSVLKSPSSGPSPQRSSPGPSPRPGRSPLPHTRPCSPPASAPGHLAGPPLVQKGWNGPPALHPASAGSRGCRGARLVCPLARRRLQWVPWGGVGGQREWSGFSRPALLRSKGPKRGRVLSGSPEHTAVPATGGSKRSPHSA